MFQKNNDNVTVTLVGISSYHIPKKPCDSNISGISEGMSTDIRKYVDDIIVILRKEGKNLTANTLILS